MSFAAGARVRLSGERWPATVRGALGTVLNGAENADAIFVSVALDNGQTAYAYYADDLTPASDERSGDLVRSSATGDVVGYSYGSIAASCDTTVVAKLARALFDERMWEEARERAEVRAVPMGYITAYVGRTESIAGTLAEVNRVLDVMWERAKPKERAECELRAARLVSRMERP